MSCEKIPISVLTMIIHEKFSDRIVTPGRVLVLKSYIDQFDLTDEEHDMLMELIDSYQDAIEEEAAFTSGMFKTFGIGLIMFGVYVLL